MSTRVMSAAKFRTECLQVLDTVQAARTEVLITKRGKPVARLVPVSESPRTGYGALRHITTIVDETDELLSTGDTWRVR